MTDWTFFTYNHPTQARDKETRKKIRGHVTKRQHALNRGNKSSAKPASRPRTLQPQDSESDKPSSSASLLSTSSSSSKQTVPSQYYSTFQLEQHLAQSRFPPKQPESRRVWQILDDDEPSEQEHCVRATPSSTPDYLYYPPLTIPSPTSSVDLNVAPVPLKQWYGWLEDYWFNGTLPKAKQRLKVNDQQLQRYISWQRSQAVSEPAMYYMMLLLATGIPVSNGQFPIVKALWLRGRTVVAINEALSDPERMTSDALIQAVGQIALHEHIYGDRAAAHSIHRPAQLRMINMRGGLNNLNLCAEVKQIMVWYDRLMAAEAGNEPYFKNLVDGRQVKDYSDTEAVGITNSASPYRNRHPGYSGSPEPENVE